VPTPEDSTSREGFAAVILTGGTGARLDGADKASLAHAGRTLLEHALEAVADADEVVVVGPSAPTPRPVVFTVEDPPGGGPAAALLAGRDVLQGRTRLIAVLAVDMPYVDAATFRRLRAALAGDRAADGAFLVDASGRRQLAGVLVADRLPTPADRHNLPMHTLLGELVLVPVAGVGPESADIDTWTDLRTLHADHPIQQGGQVNLHDWIDELSDVLDVDTELDEALVLDLARVAAHSVERRAAPITTYLLGYAAGAGEADPATIEALAAKAQRLAEGWDRPADAPDPDDLAVTVEVPDDSTVDHTADSFES
jgi:molybdopterin-guanine dinucleotide biosynthesis protein A